jgi:hypothetical protein
VRVPLEHAGQDHVDVEHRAVGEVDQRAGRGEIGRERQGGEEHADDEDLEQAHHHEPGHDAQHAGCDVARKVVLQHGPGDEKAADDEEDRHGESAAVVSGHGVEDVEGPAGQRVAVRHQHEQGSQEADQVEVVARARRGRADRPPRPHPLAPGLLA